LLNTLEPRQPSLVITRGWLERVGALPASAGKVKSPFSPDNTISNPPPGISTPPCSGTGVGHVPEGSAWQGTRENALRVSSFNSKKGPLPQPWMNTGPYGTLLKVKILGTRLGPARQTSGPCSPNFGGQARQTSGPCSPNFGGSGQICAGTSTSLHTADFFEIIMLDVSHLARENI
jgi:hypothetical protein